MVLFFVCASVKAQTVGLSGTVSETVALSVAPTFPQSSNGNTVRITLTGDEAQSSVIRVPLLVRSNSSFKISAIFESQTVELSELSLADVRATGTLVSPQIVNTLDIRREVDEDVSRPLLVLSGPRVSLGGTLNSPNNALQVTLLIRIKPGPVKGWLAHLTLVGTAGSLIQ